MSNTKKQPIIALGFRVSRMFLSISRRHKVYDLGGTFFYCPQRHFLLTSKAKNGTSPYYRMCV